MTSPEFPQSPRLPDFVAPHDGTQAEVDLRERAIVAQKFSSLVDDALLNFAEHVKHFSYPIPKDSLLLKLPIDDSSYWSVGVKSKTEDPTPDGYTTPAEGTRKSMSLQFVDHGYGRDMVDYRLCDDGVVRRWTGGDQCTKRRQQEELGIAQEPIGSDTPPEVALALTEAALSRLINVDIPNARLEQQMGYQMQPVSLAELEGLIDLFSQYPATPRVV